MGHYTKYCNVLEKQAKICGQTKYPMWLFPLLEMEPPPPNQSNGVHNCLVSCWNQSNRLRPDLPFPVGKVGMKRFFSKKPIRPRKKVRTICSSCIKLAADNITNIMSSCQQRWPLCCQSKGRGAIRMPWAMPLWHGLVQLLQSTTKKRNDNNNDEAMSTKQCCQ